MSVNKFHKLVRLNLSALPSLSCLPQSIENWSCHPKITKLWLERFKKLAFFFSQHVLFHSTLNKFQFKLKQILKWTVVAKGKKLYCSFSRKYWNRTFLLLCLIFLAWYLVFDSFGKTSKCFWDWCRFELLHSFTSFVKQFPCCRCLC